VTACTPLGNQFYLEPAMQEVGGHFQLVGLRVLQLQVAPFDAAERTKSHHLVHLRVGEPQPVVEANPLPRLKVAHPDQFELCPVLCLAHAGLCFAPPARWRNPAALSGQLSPPRNPSGLNFHKGTKALTGLRFLAWGGVLLSLESGRFRGVSPS
jgi:hypothetical protein